jgi:hypothetical protein
MFTSASIQAAEIKYFPAPKDKAQNVGVMPEIYINGDIDDKTFLGIKNIVDKNKLNQARIIINSDGGNLYEATQIGLYIRENNFTTDVGISSGVWGESLAGECYSSCVYLYIGGKYRFYDENSKFGVHQFYTVDKNNRKNNDLEESTQYVASYLLTYIRDMGVDVALFNKVSEQTSNDIELLDYNEMKKMRIFNDGYLNPEWEYLVNEDGVFYVGSQEQLDQEGVFVFGCKNKTINLTFLTSYPSVNKNTFSSYLYIDDEKIDITSKVKDADISEDILTSSYAPTSNELLKIMKSEYIGYSYDINKSQYEFYIDLDKQVKEKILQLSDFCKI